MSSNKSKAKPQTVEDDSLPPSQQDEEGVLTVTTLAELNEAIDLEEELIACDMTIKPTRQVFPCTAEDAPKQPYVYVLFNPEEEGIPEFYRGQILSYDADKKTHQAKFYDNEVYDYDLTGEAVIWGPGQLTVGGLPFYNKKTKKYETKLQARRPRWPTNEESSAAAIAGESKKRKEPHPPTEEQHQEQKGGKEKTANASAGTTEQQKLGCSRCRYSPNGCKTCRSRAMIDKPGNKRAKPSINAPKQKEQQQQQQARPSSAVAPPPPPVAPAAVVKDPKQQEKVQRDMEMKEAPPLPAIKQQQQQQQQQQPPPAATATVQPGPEEPVVSKQHQQQAVKPPPAPPAVPAGKAPITAPPPPPPRPPAPPPAVPAGKVAITAPPPPPSRPPQPQQPQAQLQPQSRPRSTESLPTATAPPPPQAAVAGKKELRKELLTKKGDKPAMKKPDAKQVTHPPPPPPPSGAVKPPGEPNKVATAAAASSLAAVQPPPPPPRLDPKVKEVSDALQQATAAFTQLGGTMNVLKEQLAAATAAATVLEKVNKKVYDANVIKSVPDLSANILGLQKGLNEVFDAGEYKHQYQQQGGPAGDNTKRPEVIFQDIPVLCGKAVAATHRHLKELLKKGLYTPRNIDRVNIPAVNSWEKAQKQAEEDAKKEAIKKQAEQQQQKQQQAQPPPPSSSQQKPQQQQQQPPPTFEEMKDFRMFDSRGDKNRDDAVRILAHGFCGDETPMSAALEMERSMYTALREPDGSCGIAYNRMLHTIWSKIDMGSDMYRPLVRWAVMEDVITPNELPRMSNEEVVARVKDWVGKQLEMFVVGEVERQQQQEQKEQQPEQQEQEPKHQ